MRIEISRAVSQLHYKVEKFCISGFRISRIAIGFWKYTELLVAGSDSWYFFEGPPRYLPLERNKADRVSSYISLWRDITT